MRESPCANCPCMGGWGWSAEAFSVCALSENADAQKHAASNNVFLILCIFRCIFAFLTCKKQKGLTPKSLERMALLTEISSSLGLTPSY